MASVVIDASIILKWVLPSDNEPYQNNALELRNLFVNNEIEVFTPTLWYFEVANLLARKFPDYADRQLMELKILLAATEVTISPTVQSNILRLTTKHHVTFYDASYHAVAMEKNATLITADEKYLQAVAGKPLAMHIKHWL